MIDIFWRVDGRFGINAILITGCRLGRIETGLGKEIRKSSIARLTRATYLNQVLTLWLGNERLQFWRGERVDQAGLGHDEEEDLGTGEYGQLICLRTASLAMHCCAPATTRKRIEWGG